MSPLGQIAIAFLLLWAIAAACYTLRIPGVHTALKRINWFRPFAHWTMFSAGPDPNRVPSVYEIDARTDIPAAGTAPWVTVASGHHWAFHGFLASPARHVAARIQALGQKIEHLQQQNSTEAAAELQRCAALIAECLTPSGAAPAGACEFRVVKRFRPHGGPPAHVIWQFTAPSHAARP